MQATMNTRQDAMEGAAGQREQAGSNAGHTFAGATDVAVEGAGAPGMKVSLLSHPSF